MCAGAAATARWAVVPSFDVSCTEAGVRERADGIGVGRVGVDRLPVATVGLDPTAIGRDDVGGVAVVAGQREPAAVTDAIAVGDEGDRAVERHRRHEVVGGGQRRQRLLQRGRRIGSGRSRRAVAGAAAVGAVVGGADVGATTVVTAAAGLAAAVVTVSLTVPA